MIIISSESTTYELLFGKVSHQGFNWLGYFGTIVKLVNLGRDFSAKLGLRLLLSSILTKNCIYYRFDISYSIRIRIQILDISASMEIMNRPVSTL